MKKSKTKFKEITVPAYGRKRRIGGAYCFKFIFAPEGNFLLKGFELEVTDYANAHFPKHLANTVRFNSNEHTSSIQFSKRCSIRLLSPHIGKDYTRSKYEVMSVDYANNPDAIKLKFKRLPQRWIKEYDYLISQQKIWRGKTSESILNLLRNE